MTHRLRKTLLWISTGTLGLGLAGTVGCNTIATSVDQQQNTVRVAPPYRASEGAQALHKTLLVADLHDDALLWSRDLLKRYDYGHSDLPRLQEGRVSLQVFSTVTKTPKGLNFERNSADSDNITLLAKVQRWPEPTWSSLAERALYQAEKLHRAAQDSQGRMMVLRSQADVRAFMQTAYPKGAVLGALLSTEGLHALEGKLDNLDRLYTAGYRLAGLTHFFDNEVGGSAHGMEKGGLTDFGRKVLARMDERRMIVDLAHASPKLIDDVLTTSQRPVLVSHTGVQGTCKGPRNLSDAHIKAIAARGGIIGIGYFEGAVCGINVDAIVKAINHTVRLAGVRHVALGSDFNGSIRAPFDTTGLVLITEALQAQGYSEQDIAAIMGGNVLRFLQEQLPLE